MPVENPSALRGLYPEKPARLRHALAADRLLTLPALALLARRLPPSQVEYYPGDAFAEQGPVAGLGNGLTPEETVRRIAECNSWMVLKNVGTDPEYAPIVDSCLDAIEPYAASETGAMHMRVGFIFVSSPGAVVPLHWDPEHNVLMQISGSKRVFVYAGGGLVPAERHEAYHVDQAAFKLDRTPDYDACEEAYDLDPGDALHIPLKAPHAVVNGPAPSISFSVTWRSAASDREARLRRANHAVRKIGGAPPEPGVRSARDAAAIFCQRALSRLRKAGGR